MATKINDVERLEAIERLQKFLDGIPVRSRVEIMEEALEFCRLKERGYLWRKIKRKSITIPEVAEIYKLAHKRGFTPEYMEKANQIAKELIQATA